MSHARQQAIPSQPHTRHLPTQGEPAPLPGDDPETKRQLAAIVFSWLLVALITCAAVLTALHFTRKAHREPPHATYAGTGAR